MGVWRQREDGKRDWVEKREGKLWSGCKIVIIIKIIKRKSAFMYTHEHGRKGGIGRGEKLKAKNRGWIGSKHVIRIYEY